MARHDQRPNDRMMTCPNCRKGDCENCVDVLRVVYAEDTICKCTRKGHSGEPVQQQIVDPADGTVYGPCMTISPEGKVKIEHDLYEDREFGSRYVRVACKRCAYSVYVEDVQTP